MTGAPVSRRPLDENPHYLVSRVELVHGAETQIQHENRDLVIVALTDATLTPSKGADAETLKSGDVRFIARDAYAKILNSQDKPAEALAIELKHHWDAEMRPCTEPMKCTRPIRMGSDEIGETTSLFTNGFITAYSHRLVLGGTLTSSYFSSKGKDHLLLVALTDLRAVFDGTEENLKRGQVYTSEATEIEVDADQNEARWVVVRIEIPK